MRLDDMLRVDHVSFAYGDRVVLTDVSLHVQPGEMVGVIGPNGSGKSTLLRLVCGLLRPSHGRIVIGQDDLTRLTREELARRVAVVPQNVSLPDNFTAGEIVLLGRTPHLGLFQSESRRDLSVTERALQLCEARPLAERRVGELSGGERQRVVIARALAQEPQLLLLDEPTSQLDISHQMGILNLISDLGRAQRLAILAVFHDLNLAAQYCDRLAVLRGGRILAEGTPKDVITAEIVEAAYGAEVCVVPHPRNGLPVALVAGGNGRSRKEL